MAQQDSHVHYGVGAAVIYGLLGFAVFNIYIENIILALMIVYIASLVPDMDTAGTPLTQSLVNLFALAAPLSLIMLVPDVHHGGLPRLTLISATSFMGAREMLIRGLKSYASRRGMLHSFPAAVIAFQLVYLFFQGSYWADRMYLGGAALVGYFTHLLLDACTKTDQSGKPISGDLVEIPVFKLHAKTLGATISTYISIAVLGYLISQDIGPDMGYLIRSTIAHL